jgi:hypothetical protein
MRCLLQAFAEAFRIAAIRRFGDYFMVIPEDDSHISDIVVDEEWVRENNAKAGGYYVVFDNGSTEYLTEDEFKMRATLIE